MQKLYWRLSCHGMYCFIIICWLVLGNAAAILGLSLVMECIVLLLLCWLELGNAAAILETLSSHGMYCFIIICWLALGNAAAILGALYLVMEYIVLLLFVGWYLLMQKLYWRLCLVMECIF